ncbi:MAG: 16S rRNA processing protein RimM [Acidobacteria bacterium]|nr:16S rRNA processing protein RimM [Acidobacteriota bacterium]
MVAAGLRLRGPRGRLTARLVPGGIDQLEGREWVMVGRPGQAPARLPIEEYSIYGDRVVLKFRGIDTAGAAAGFVGQDILMPCNGLVDLPEGSYYIFELIGLTVRTRAGRTIGIVRDVVPTGGTPLLAVEPGAGEGGDAHDPILLPAARSICTAIDPASGWITIDPPEGLLELYGI